ncbi:VOC family protein [Streptomyces sp. MNP-20]|uniref:VOC family protein n=1 Tax=Streptomyces sp. MNP-20 TaxID=2721165 RepID=UPI0015579844|nr:VOC family protein [Streptomyces sp. MNP-20]
MSVPPPGPSRAPGAPPATAPSFNHIGVQTADLENSLNWYQDFFGCTPNWTLSTFSSLTLSRLPGITTLVELECGSVRFHLFDRQGSAAQPPDPKAAQYQHVCLQAASSAELVAWREHWLALFRSGSYTFADQETATDVVVDADGVESFYFLDVNGLEFEFTYIPGARP